MITQNNKKTPIYQQFYKKRLNTETFSSPSLKEEFIKLSAKIENQIQTVKKNMRVKNLKIFRVKQNLSTIENKEKMIRDQLKAKIQQKIKLSQSNLEKIMVEKRSHSKSKDKLRQTTISRIKSMQKTSLQESFRKSRNYSKNTEDYFQQRKERANITRTTSFIENQAETRYARTNYKMHQSVTLIEPRKKILPNVLKIQDKTLKEKQLKKNFLLHQKQSKNLQELMDKFKQIEIRRQAKSKRLKQVSSLIQNQRKKCEGKTPKHNITRSMIDHKNTSRKSYDGQIKEIIKNKNNFSQEYNKKLQEKMAIKEYYRKSMFEEGNSILQRQLIDKQQRKNKKIINQTIKEAQSYFNFRNKQKWTQ